MKRILALFMCIILLLCGCSSEKFIKEDVKIYFSNAEKTGVESETRRIKYLEEENKLVILMEELLKGPENTNLKNIISKDTKVNEVIVNNNLAIIDFSKEFISENETDNLIIRACVVHTITSVPGIENVLITIESSPSNNVATYNL
jgi:germination protein M